MSVFTNLPTGPAVDGSTNSSPRVTGYQDQFIVAPSNKETFAAAEGSYFSAISPTPGTGIIGHAAPTTFDETKAYIQLYNAGTKIVYPQFIHLHDTAVSVGDARVQFTVAVDTGNRRSSGGTALTVSNTNMNSLNVSGASVYAGAVVCSAATSVRRVLGNFCFRGTIDVVEDDYELVFGGLGGGSFTGSRAATVGEFSRNLPPVAIGPNQSLMVYQWAAAQSTGPTFEVVFGYIER